MALLSRINALEERLYSVVYVAIMCAQCLRYLHFGLAGSGHRE